MAEAESTRPASPNPRGSLERSATGLAAFNKIGKKVALNVAANKAVQAASLNSQSKGDPNNIKVGLRCRPLSKMELGLGEESIAEFSPPQLCMTNPAPKQGEPENFLFTYDFVYDWSVPTETVFQDMGAPLVEKLFDGFNGTLFAYGQVQSCKSCSLLIRPGAVGKPHMAALYSP